MLGSYSDRALRTYESEFLSGVLAQYDDVKKFMWVCCEAHRQPAQDDDVLSTSSYMKAAPLGEWLKIVTVL